MQFFKSVVLLVVLFFVSCADNDNAYLFDSSSSVAPNVNLDSISSLNCGSGVTHNLSGTCTGGADIEVDCGAGPVSTTCNSGSFMVPNVPFPTLCPAVCVTTLSSGGTPVAGDTESSNPLVTPFVDLDPVDSISTTGNHPMVGSCAPDGALVSVDCGSGPTSPVACSSGIFNIPVVGVPSLPASCHSIITDSSTGLSDTDTESTPSGVNPVVTLNDISSITAPGTYPMSGSCSPDGSSITVDCGAGASAPVTCSGGVYSGANTTISSIPATCTASLVAPNGQTDSDSDITAISLPEVSIDDPEVYIPGSYPMTGSCSPDGSSVTVDCGSGVSAPVICSGGSYSVVSVNVSTLPATCSANLIDQDSNQATDSTDLIPLPEINLDPIISITTPGSHSMSGSCSPDGAAVSVDCGSGPVSGTCSGGSFSLASVNIASLPASCVSVVTDSATGLSDSDTESTAAPVDGNPEVTIDDISTITTPGTHFLSGTCSPDGSSVTLDCGAGPSAAVTCSGGVYSGASTVISSVPATCTATLVAPSGLVDTDSDITGMNNPSVDLDIPAVSAAGNHPTSGACSPEGSSITVDCGAGPSAPVTCSGGSFTVPSVTFAGSGPWTCSADLVDPSGQLATDSENVLPVEIDAMDDSVASSQAGSVNAIDVSGNDTDSFCAPIVYSQVACTNCTAVANPSAPNYDITPTAAGAWSFTYKATCSDGSTSDTASVIGTALAIPAITATDDPVSASEAGVVVPTVNVSLNDGNTNCTPITYTAGACTNCTFTGSLPSVDITPTAAGTWNLAYAATCSDGTTTSNAKVLGTAADITANDNPVTVSEPAVTSIVNVDTAAGSTGTADSSSNCAPITYSANCVLNCTFSGTGPSYNIIPTAAGAWKLTYTATCANGSTSDTADVTGTAAEVDSPDKEIDPSTEGIALGAEDLSLLVTSSSCTPITYTLGTLVNATVSGTLPSVIVTPTNPGAWEVPYTATCANGSTADSGKLFGNAVSAVEINAVDDEVSVSEAGVALASIDVSSNDTSNACAPITYTTGTCTNCTFTGSLPSVVITPAAAGAWDLAYTATCSDGSTTDNAKVFGTAASIDAVDDPQTDSAPGVALSSIDVSTNDTDSSCAPITYTAGACTNCTFTGTLPNVVITPTALGVWDLAYTATCSDGVTNDTAKVSGEAKQCVDATGPSATKYDDFGDGLATATAWEIYNETQLEDLAQNGPMDKFYILCNDIDMSSIGNDTGIGSFTGDFNGNNKKIYNGADDTGVFTEIAGGKVYDLTIDNYAVTCGAADCGVLASKATGGADLQSIEISNSGVVSGGLNTGGIIGNFDDATLDQVNGTALTVTCTHDQCGGAFGIMANSVVLDNIVYTGTVSNTAKKTGGLVGYMKNSAKIQAASAGAISLTITTPVVCGSSECGGLIGAMDNTSELIDLVFDIDVDGFTNSSSTIGGAVGIMNDSSKASGSSLGDTESQGDVNCFGSCGGFVGALLDNSFLEFVKSSGNTVGHGTQTGGLAGKMSDNSSISNSEVLGTVTCLKTRCGGAAGYMEDNAKLIGVKVLSSSKVDALSLPTADIASGMIGGLVGYMIKGVQIESSETHADVDGKAGNVGGAIGSINLTNANAYIKNTHATGDVYTEASAASAGGFIGGAYRGITIENCFATGNVESNSTGTGNGGAGGFMGAMAIASTQTFPTLIKNNYVTGDVLSNANRSAVGSGGFVGSIRSANSAPNHIIFEKNFALGSVRNPNGNAGGFVARFGGNSFEIRESFSAGSLVEGAGKIGGFAGMTENGGNNIITDSYSLVTNVNRVGTLTGVETHSAGFIAGTGTTTQTYSISNSYTISNLKAVTGNRCGGFVANVQPLQTYNFDNVFSVGDVDCVTSDYFMGTHSMDPSGTLTDSYYYSGATCVGSPCDGSHPTTTPEFAAPEATLSNFYLSTHPVYTTWDFTTVWEALPGRLPALRCPTGFPDCALWNANR